MKIDANRLCYVAVLAILNLWVLCSGAAFAQVSESRESAYTRGYSDGFADGYEEGGGSTGMRRFRALNFYNGKGNLLPRLYGNELPGPRALKFYDDKGYPLPSLYGNELPVDRFSLENMIRAETLRPELPNRGKLTWPDLMTEQISPNNCAAIMQSCLERSLNRTD